jgi:hypothetical protein
MEERSIADVCTSRAFQATQREIRHEWGPLEAARYPGVCGSLGRLVGLTQPL